jgi:hypothetical protein
MESVPRFFDRLDKRLERKIDTNKVSASYLKTNLGKVRVSF